MPLIYGSVCSGIEAATVAWHGFGWKPAFFAEIEPFPRAVLAHHWPDVPVHGDFTTIQDGDYEPIDLLVGGTPCQDFSVAGLRAGMAGDRGNLTLQFLELARRLRPRWLVWENVPGVFSSLNHAAPDPCPPPPPLDMECDGTEVEIEDEYDSQELHAFNCFLAGLSELGYGFSYRTFDAQYFGLAQRRARVFVVGYLGDWRRAAAVLFERHSLSWNSPPGRKSGKVAPTIPSRSLGGGGLGTDFDCDGGLIAAIQERACCENPAAGPDGAGFRTDGVAYTLEARTTVQAVAFGGNNTSGPISVATALNACSSASGRMDFESETFIAHFPRSDGGVQPEIDADSFARIRAANGGTSRSYVAFAQNQRDEVRPLIVAGALAAEPGTKQQTYVAFDCKASAGFQSVATSGVTPTLRAMSAQGRDNGGGQLAVQHDMAVRRLTPRECERLQGFPDDYTRIPWRRRPPENCPDGPRYKALGNSMAVPVMRWIGQRIAMVEALQ